MRFRNCRTIICNKSCFSAISHDQSSCDAAHRHATNSRAITFPHHSWDRDNRAAHTLSFAEKVLILLPAYAQRSKTDVVSSTTGSARATPLATSQHNSLRAPDHCARSRRMCRSSTRAPKPVGTPNLVARTPLRGSLGVLHTRGECTSASGPRGGWKQTGRPQQGRACRQGRVTRRLQLGPKKSPVQGPNPAHRGPPPGNMRLGSK